MRLSIEALWRQCQTETIAAVAKRVGKTRQGLLAEFQQAGLYGNAVRDPSPRQIKQACLMLQSRWDETTRMERWIGSRRPKILA